MASSIGDLVARVFGADFDTPGRHIVTTTLEAAAEINSFVILQLPGELVSATSADDKGNCRDDLYSDEFIHSLNFPGSPPAVLQLKVGARYMFLRNIDPQRNIINGVSVVLLAIRPFSLAVQLPSGRVALIPRITFVIDSKVSGLPFTLTRRQFPLIPAYALTVHRVQGQSLRTVGLYVTGDMFCHGMLYTFLSRVGGWESVHIFSDDDCGPWEIRNLVRPHAVAHLW
jgi:ATP-dependent DNA helicase PIF1